MKICFVAEDYFFNGGGERILTLLCNELQKKYDVTIISLLQKEKESNYSLDKDISFSFANIKKLSWGGFTKLSELYYLKNNILYLESFDIIIGLGVVPNILLGMLSPIFRKNISIIAWEHGSFNQLSLIMRVFRYIFYRKLDLIVILTEYDMKKFMKLNRNIKTVNNFIVVKNKRNIDLYKTKRFIFIGRLSKQKGIKYLLKIFKLYYLNNDYNKTWQVKIVGDGPYRKELIDFIKKNNLNDKIEILLSTSQIEREYNISSCLLLTSCIEGFPMVLLEAVSFGLPVISFDCPTGPAEIIQNEHTGFLIPQYNIKQFVKKMCELQDNQALLEEFSVNSYNIADKYLVNNIMPQWIDILEELGNSHERI